MTPYPRSIWQSQTFNLTSMRTVFLLLFVLFTGCSSGVRSGPPTIDETSLERQTLADRVTFVEQYVTFQRTYHQLQYDIEYHNNGGGMMPGPSDWDIKLVAIVPVEELEQWIPEGITKSKQNPHAWLSDVPGEIPTAGITEWYVERNSVMIGIDRENSIVAYRNTTL